MGKNRIKKVRFILILVLTFCPGVFSSGFKSSAQEMPALVLAGSSLWSKAYDIFMEGNIGYCSFLNGLVILDLTDIKKPTLISQLYLGGGYSITVRDKIAFLAAGKEGLKVIDVSDPLSPRLKGTALMSGEARDVVLSGPYAFVADNPGGLVIVDIHDPTAPKTVGKWASPGECLAVAIQDDLAFLADGSAGLQIINVQDPARPALVGTWDTDGTAESIALLGNYAYVADGPSGLKVVDVSKASAPQQVASMTTSGYCRGVSADGKLVCVGNLYDGGFQVMDITNPASPALLATMKYTMYNEGWNVVVNGNQLSVIDYFSGIGFFDLSTPHKPKMTGFYPTPSTIVAAAAQDKIIYAVGELSGLCLLDSSDPAKLRRLATTTAFRGVQGLAVAGDLAYVTDRWSVRVFDVRNPSEARQVQAIKIPSGVPRAIIVQGSLVYLTADHAGLYIIDVSDLKATKLLGHYPMARFTYGLDIAGDLAYLANNDTGFHIINVRDPSSPQLQGSIKLDGEPCGVAVQGKYANVACGPAGLQVVDISNPASPRVVGSCAVDDFANGVAVKGHFAYVTDANGGLKKIDIRHPESPKVVASFDTPGEASCPVLTGEFLVVPDAFSLLVFRQD